MQRGLLDPEKVDPFSLFLETGGLTYCQYKDSERVLGNTFGMCILQVDYIFRISAEVECNIWSPPTVSGSQALFMFVAYFF